MDFAEISQCFVELFETDLSEEQINVMCDKNLPEGALSFFEKYSTSRQGLNGREFLMIGYLIGVTVERMRGAQ